MKQRISRVSVFQFGKVSAFLSAIWAIVFEPFVILCNGGTLAAVLLAMVLYPIIGFISGIITAVLYNLAAKWIGGVEITLESVTEY